MPDLRRIIDGISDLPTLPDVVSRLNRMISDPRTSAGDINDVISRDLSLSAKILKLVNSPFYGFPRRITTITYAVVILGFNTVRNLALSTFVFDAFKKGAPGFDLRAFWGHSIATAVAAAAVAKTAKTGAEEDAFIAGLLHDVGKVVMNQHLHDDLARVSARVKTEDGLFLEAERAELDYDHSQVGALLLEKWNLPESVVRVVRSHHAPTGAEATPDARLAATVHFADILARALRIGSGGDRRIPRLQPDAWTALGLSWEQAGRLMDETQDEVNRADAFFDLTHA